MQKDNDQNKANELRVSLKGLGFFVEKDYLFFIFKKTEKLASALYLVTSFFKDEEPLKWSFREKGMYLLSHALIVNDSDAFDRDISLRVIFSTSLEILSMLQIASVSRLISEMNSTILKREFEALIDRLRKSIELETADKGFVLSDSFFNTVPEDFSGPQHKDKGHHGEKLRNGHEKQHFSEPRLPPHNSSNYPSIEQRSTTKDRKNDRKDKIINLLSQGGTLTVKDFTKVIHHCSEKTIQRELLDLVDKGILKKEGERRWSRYSLISH